MARRWTVSRGLTSALRFGELVTTAYFRRFSVRYSVRKPSSGPRVEPSCCIHCLSAVHLRGESRGKRYPKVSNTVKCEYWTIRVCNIKSTKSAKQKKERSDQNRRNSCGIIWWDQDIWQCAIYMQTIKEARTMWQQALLSLRTSPRQVTVHYHSCRNPYPVSARSNTIKTLLQRNVDPWSNDTRCRWKCCSTTRTENAPLLRRRRLGPCSKIGIRRP